MSVVRILLGGSELQLMQNTSIGMTFKIANVADFTSVQSNVSTSISVPYTEANAVIFEHALQVNSNTTIPYTANDCTLLINGVYIFQGGVLVLEESNSRSFLVTVYSGNIDLLSQISGNINDVAFSADRVVFNLANIIANIDNTWTDNILFPVLDYGDIGSILNAISTFPAVFSKALFNKIITATGATMSGTFWTSDTFFASTILPFSKDTFTNGTLFLADVSFDLSDATTDTLSDSETVDTTEVLLSLTGMTETATQYVNGQFEGTVTVANFATSSTPAGGAVTVSLVISRNNDVSDLLGTPVTITGNGDYTVTTSTQEELVNTDTVELAIRLIYAIPSAQTVTFDADVSAKTFNSFDIDTFISLDKSTIYFGDLLPEMTKLNFIKGVLNTFGLIAIYNNIDSTLDLKEFDEVVDNKASAVDWGDKIDFSKAVQLKYEASGYGKENVYEYKQDDTVDEDLGTGITTIANDNLPDEVTVVSLPFAASETTTETPYPNVALISKVVSGYAERDELLKTEQRYLYTTAETDTVNVNDGTTTTPSTNYKAGRFIDELQTNNLGFDNSLLTDYWQAITGVIQNYKKLTAYFNLNEIDIQSLDFFKPVFINATDGRMTINGYFYINEISNFTGEESTQVQLIKLDL